MDASSRPDFTQLVPASHDYACQPVSRAFTWSAIVAPDQAGEWYLVAFRSTRRAGADEDQLRRLDDLAHDEAGRAPGFVHYFKGPATERGECLSFCLWDSRRHARAAAGRPDHARAATIVHEAYDSYTLEFQRVRKRRGAQGFEFEAYDRPPRPV